MAVTFLNDAVRSRPTRTLYVIMTTDGEFVLANHKLAYSPRPSDHAHWSTIAARAM